VIAAPTVYKSVKFLIKSKFKKKTQ